jgi:hypothetical protein
MTHRTELALALIVAGSLAAPSGSLHASSVTLSNTFTNGTIADADQVNQNFDDVKTAVDDNDARLSTAEGAISSGFGGDGSAGDLNVTSDLDWSDTPPTNPNFRDVTIASGQTLTVPAGTTIRCSGRFVNDGTIRVLAGASNAETSSISGSAFPHCLAGTAHPGDSLRSAGSGKCNHDPVAYPIVATGGQGGLAIPRAVAVTSFDRFRIGGGSGGGWVARGKGGGLLKVYCAGPVEIAGSVVANGEDGLTQTGGGGGGIVVLGSPISVDASGTIDANGGDGGSDETYGAPPGGGGGGIVVLVAPNVSTSGTINVDGGTPVPPTSGTLTNSARTGAGGGASGGNGGNGGQLINTGRRGAGSAGAPGYSVTITANPATMLH